MTDKLAAIKRGRTRNDLISAYEAYQRREPDSLSNLLMLVRNFAYMKLYRLEHDFKDFGSAETVDDWTQDVSIKVWQKLKEFESDPRSTPAQFYSWVHKIAFNRRTDAFNDLIREKKSRVPLFIKSEEGGDEEGDNYEEENPLIHNQPDNGFSVRIPASVQGVDLTICKLLLTTVRREADGSHRGRNYAEVAQVLGMTENAVKKRLQHLRNRLKAEREQKGGATHAVAAD